jgi:RNA polymerase sigma-70 factor (sigma-E family)
MGVEYEGDYVEYVSARLPVWRRAAYLLCGDQHRADDVVQATTTELYRRWRRIRTVENIDGYVYRMLLRKYLDEHRSAWSRVFLVRHLPEKAESPPERSEDRDSLRAALAGLTRAQRTVLVLRFVCDASVEEVAETLRCSPSNVKSHTARGLAAMRRAMGAEYDPNGPTTEEGLDVHR